MTTMQVRFKGRVALQVPGGVKADPVVFKVSVGPETKSKHGLVLIIG